MIANTSRARVAAMGAASVVALLAGAHAARAQQSGPQQVNSTPTVGEIVVTAQKRSERLVDVPISIVAVSGNDLQSMGVTNTQDLTKIAPSLTFSAYGPYVQPSIRGVSSLGDGPGDDPDIAIYLDGVYQPNQLVNGFDLPDVSRVEVDSGPQGTLFGRNATGGAVQIFTLDPTFTPKLMLSDTEGMYSGGGIDSKLSAHISGPLIGDTVAGGLTVYDRADQGYIRDVLTDKRIGINNDLILRGKLLFKPTDKLQVLVTGYYTHDNDPASEANSPLNGNTIGQATLVENPVKPYDYQGNGKPAFATKTWGGSVKTTYDLDSGSINSLTSYALTEVIGPNGQDGDASPLAAAEFFDNGTEQTVSEDLNFASRKFDKFNFVAGVNYYYDDSKMTDPFIVNNATYEYARNITNAYAVYVDGNYDLTDHLTLTGGVRYSIESKTNYGGITSAPDPSLINFRIPGASHTWTAPTGRASLQYKFSPRTNVYFTFSQGFKSGVYNEFATTPVNPETIDAYEVGFKTSTRRYSLSAAAFYYNYSNIQIEAYNGTVETVQNATAATIYGLELNGAVQATGDVKFTGGLTYLPEANYGAFEGAPADIPIVGGGNCEFGAAGCGSTTEFNATGRREIRAPVFSGNVSANYDHNYNWGKISSNVSLFYTTSYNFTVDGRLQQPAHANLNAQVSWSPLNSGFKFTVWGKNLTNAVSYNSIYADTLGNIAFYAPPLEAGVTLAYQY
jgi:iron complex outermembrane receptor protein